MCCRALAAGVCGACSPSPLGGPVIAIALVTEPEAVVPLLESLGLPTFFTLTPPFTDALLLAVTNITAAAGITAGTIYAEATAPSGRTNPPT